MLAANPYTNHHTPLISLDIASVLDVFKDGASSLKEFYQLNKTLGQLVKLMDYTQVDGNNADDVEEALNVIDDTIDTIKERQDSFITKIFSNPVLTKLLTMQFILSNKLADFELASR